MSEVLIRLKKEWVNGETSYPVGQLLKTDEAGADALVKDGTAELYEPKANDEIKVSPMTGGLNEEDVKSIVEKSLAEANKAAAKNLPVNTPDKEDFAKKGGFVNFADFAHQVFKAGKTGTESERLNKWMAFAKATGLSEGVNAAGGFLVPTEFRATLLSNMIEESMILPRAFKIPMATNRVGIPAIVDTTHASSLFGGVIIYRPDEGGEKTSSKPNFGKVELTLHKLVGLCYATDELLEDSPITLEPLLTRLFSAAIAWQQDEDFINGTGAGQALGILASPCLVSVTKETGQAATTIVSENIDKMWARMYPPSQRNAVWMANNDTYPQLAALARTVGTGGSAAGLLVQLAGSPQQTLCGRPLLLTEHCQTLGTQGDLILADWSQYLVGQKATGLKVDSSIHVNFIYDETAFRFVLRYDGQPWWSAALTPKHSTATLSPFVVLDSRA